ncbi:Phosphoadenosine phosphosulfate reductase [Scheffersomyces stipitis CBS 6054]|uniref:phosphoadenylyl-sulfate reductase (thioredoxin) n=1 Tax=Scheffersomyces stipitis (strain ATCC 58785 / CBS 6054 / NBRC 10063 / NRRL Y-11545) TaxID=322104 RepID=A3LZM8_PICST|nr:Phosphoadenosine phosphosulfate reductase [Scheffersomyces stipitis CBS 6054]ABN68181.2 Phosphoadenosine phosphosulfate reductase [Scheffersomyces stipitis CBS 6054]
MTSTPSVVLTPEHLKFLNEKLQFLEPQEIIRWAQITFPNLFQTTAFGLTGLATIDMISKIATRYSEEKYPIDLIFIDTLHHFPQTYDLVENIKIRYNPQIHVFKPKDVETESEFSVKYGEQLWETDDSYYDFLVKVEPSQRAYKQLGVSAVLTGRRRSQGGARGTLPVIEIEESSGTIKINPLCNWDFKQVKSYIDENKVPYNELLDLGYKSIGDWHSTVPVAEGEDERSGRWKGKAKTECGIHETSKFAQFLEKANEAKKEVV